MMSIKIIGLTGKKKADITWNRYRSSRIGDLIGRVIEHPRPMETFFHRTVICMVVWQKNPIPNRPRFDRHHPDLKSLIRFRRPLLYCKRREDVEDGDSSSKKSMPFGMADGLGTWRHTHVAIIPSAHVSEDFCLVTDFHAFFHRE
jgi:hypothetical protein